MSVFTFNDLKHNCD